MSFWVPMSRNNFSIYFYFRCRYNDEYVPNFVLQGTRNLDCKRLATDLQNSVKVACF